MPDDVPREVHAPEDRLGVRVPGRCGLSEELHRDEIALIDALTCGVEPSEVILGA